jgi:DNA modification methylase
MVGGDMTAVDVDALKRFLDSELYSRLEDFYLRQPQTLPRPDFKTFYGWLVGDIAAEFFNHPAKMNPWLSAILWQHAESDDVVLDPMCGVGGTVIPGLLLKPPRKVVLNDIVPEYVNVAKTLCEEIANTLQLPTKVEAYTMNASCLYEKIGRRSVDIIITSPPYGKLSRTSPKYGLPFRQEYRGGGWGDLATFANGHYSAAWLQVITSMYLMLDQRGQAVINVKNTRTYKQKLPPLTNITEEHMKYVGFKNISTKEFVLGYESPYAAVRRVRGENTDHLQKEYVVTGEKP